jgi:hypothetical protein
MAEIGEGSSRASLQAAATAGLCVREGRTSLQSVIAMYMKHDSRLPVGNHHDFSAIRNDMRTARSQLMGGLIWGMSSALLEATQIGEREHCALPRIPMPLRAPAHRSPPN